MKTDWLNNLDALTAIGAFGLVMAAWIAFMLLFAMRRQKQQHVLRKRLEHMTVDGSGQTQVLRLFHEGAEATTVVPKHAKLSIGQRWEESFRAADLPWPSQTALTGLLAVMATSLAIVYLLSHSLLWACLAAAIVLVAAKAAFKHRINTHNTRFEQQFLDALDIAARSLRAGHPVVGAFRLISEEVAAPVGTIFAGICQQQELGVSVEEALRLAAQKCPSSDLRLFATSVSIQILSGGNLADMMERLSLVIRDRIKVWRRMRVLTAQTQFSKRVLVALPPFMFVLLNAINPTYMHPLYSTKTGMIILCAAAGSVMLGMWLMNRLTVLHY
jgi:tight adherence protein B